MEDTSKQPTKLTIEAGSDFELIRPHGMSSWTDPNSLRMPISHILYNNNNNNNNNMICYYAKAAENI